MLNKIIELFFPFTENPEDFIVKNTSTWYSNKYRLVLYSCNRGKSFRRIFEASSPLFSHGDCILKYNWTLDELTFNAENTPFGKYVAMFKCLDDIHKFEETQRDIYEKGIVDVQMKRDAYVKRFNENISS